LGPPATALGVAGNSSSSAAAVNSQRSTFASLSSSNNLPSGFQGLQNGFFRTDIASLGGASPPGGLSPSAEFAGNSRAGFAAGFGQAGSRRLDLTLLANAEAIYGPLLLEQRNVLLAGGKIIGLLDDAAAEALRGALQGLAVLDCSGCLIVPGFVDCHVHITGGGGEAGPASRCVLLGNRLVMLHNLKPWGFAAEFVMHTVCCTTFLQVWSKGTCRSFAGRVLQSPQVRQMTHPLQSVLDFFLLLLQVSCAAPE
jgi:hypothetical protein